MDKHYSYSENSNSLWLVTFARIIYGKILKGKKYLCRYYKRAQEIRYV